MRDAGEVRTRKLYYEDAYRTEFEGELIGASYVKRGKGGYVTVSPAEEDGGEIFLDAVLDATCFFPEEGGQCPDTGSLGGLAVRDVQIADREIHHYLELPAAGAPSVPPSLSKPGEARALFAEDRLRSEGEKLFLSGSLIFQDRFSNMQQHSGEHLLSGTVHRLYGYENVGFHLSAREVTLDFDGVIPEADIPVLEREVNEAIWRDIPSRIAITSPGEREALSYRSKLDLDGEVRIVTFPGVDSCACCAPHVKRTGEIGLLKVVSMIRWKGGVRLAIACGDRALRFFAEEHRGLGEAARLFSTSTDKVVPQINRLKAELREKEAALLAAESQLLRTLAETLPSDSPHALIFVDAAGAQSMRDAVKWLMERHSGICGVFAGEEGGELGFVIGSPGVDCRRVAEALRSGFGARGGGRPELIQGSVRAGRAELRAALAQWPL